MIGLAWLATKIGLGLSPTRWIVGGALVALVAAGSWLGGHHTATNAEKARQLARIQRAVQVYKDTIAENQKTIDSLRKQDVQIDQSTAVAVEPDAGRLRDDTARVRARLSAVRCGPTVTLFGSGNSGGGSSDSPRSRGPDEQDPAVSKPKVIGTAVTDEAADPIDQVNSLALAKLTALAEKCAAKIETRASALEAAEGRNQQ